MNQLTFDIILPIVINGIALAVAWGKTSQRIDQLEKDLTQSKQSQKEDTGAINEIKTQGERLSVALWGIDGQNGMRGNIKELSTKVEGIKDDISDIREELRDSASRQERMTQAIEAIQKKLDI